MRTRLDIRKEKITIYHILRQPAKFVFKYQQIDEYYDSEPTKYQKIVMNILDNIPFKSLIFKETILSVLIATDDTAELLSVIQSYMYDIFLVRGKRYSDLEDFEKAWIEDYCFDYIVQKPSETYDLTRIELY